jgi:hypothetical protein
MLYMKRSRLKTFNENSLDRFISDKKNVLNKTVSAKNLAGWMGGWMDGRESRVKDCLQQSKI